MKHRLIVTNLMIVVVLGAALVAPAAAGSSGLKLTGGIRFSAPDWGDLSIWQQYNVQQVNAVTHAARGIVNWKIYSPNDGWRSIDARAICLAVTNQSDGSQTAIVVARLIRVKGWGGGARGEYARFWVRDGGTPGAAGDQWMMESQ